MLLRGVIAGPEPVHGSRPDYMGESPMSKIVNQIALCVPIYFINLHPKTDLVTSNGPFVGNVIVGFLVPQVSIIGAVA